LLLNSVAFVASDSAAVLSRFPFRAPASFRPMPREHDTGELMLVFPNTLGRVEHFINLLDRGFHPIQMAAGITTPRLGLASMINKLIFPPHERDRS
jgi:hypothetical protein